MTSEEGKAKSFSDEELAAMQKCIYCGSVEHESIYCPDEGITDFEALIERADEITTAKGFWDEGVDFGHQLLMIAGETVEAQNELRKNADHLFIYFRDSDGKPEGFGFELADVVIRVMSLSHKLGIPLEARIKAKMQFNETRPDMHGDKLF